MPPVLSKLFSTLPSGIWVKLVELVASFGPRAFSSLSNGARVRMIDALHRILRYLQNGFDVGWQYSVSAPSTRIAIATLILANVFEPWARAGWAPRSAEELTEMSGSGADVELIRRLLDALVGQRLFLKTKNHYQGWTGSWADDLVNDPSNTGAFLGFFEWTSAPLTHFPRYLAKTGFKNPTDSKAGCFQDLYGPEAESYNPPLGDAAVLLKLKSMLAGDEKLKARLAGGSDDDDDVFDQLDGLIEAKKTPLLAAWAEGMGAFMEAHSRYNHRSWTELFPTRSIAEDAREGRVLVVDIGGGKGHDGLRFAGLHPDIADGSVVVQDLPHVIDGSRRGALAGQDKVVGRAYDYLEPQPIEGARVYYIHVVIHNADDARAVEVLRNTVGAMEKGYSQLLIHESVIDVYDPHANATSQDLLMAGMFSARERTRDRWTRVIHEAGLVIRDIKMEKGFPDAIIVTEKA